MEIKTGDVLTVTTASGATAQMRATSEPMQGRDFPVVWVCTEEEYARLRHDQDRQGIPWPLNAVKVE